MTKHNNQQRSNAEEKYVRVKNLVLTGINITDACKQVGWSTSSFRRTRNKIDPDFYPDTLSKAAQTNGYTDKNWKHGWIKDGNTSLFVKNPEIQQVIEEKISELKEYLEDHRPIQVEVPEPMGDHLLVIDPADIHIGKLARSAETGDDYTIEIATKRCLEGVDQLLLKAVGFGVERILLVVGNDCLHIDSPHRVTTAGTPQDTDGMWWEAYIAAKIMYIEIIDRLRKDYPLDIIYNPSNHDYMSGFYLADSLSSWFANCEGVNFDSSIRHRKYYTYGKNLIGLTHGDGAKENDTPMLMANEASQEWSRTDFHYWYLHHVHHKKKWKWADGKDYIGVTVEYLRSPSPADGWHDRNGYISPKAMEAFLHHKEKGQVARLTNYF